MFLKNYLDEQRLLNASREKSQMETITTLEQQLEKQKQTVKPNLIDIYVCSFKTNL